MTTTHTQTDNRVGMVKLANPATNLEFNRSNVEWVNLSEIVPNPLNPRKDDSIQSEVMQNIIKSRGWEEPLTVYKKGRMYVLLSGHRRFFAAKQVGKIKQVPVFVVEAPTSHQNEIERIASLQSGRVDWTPFEWARFTYERWIAWGQPNATMFARQINLDKRQVANYIDIMSFYPTEEIQAGLKTKRTTLSSLLDLSRWIKNLYKLHPTLVEDLSEELIRRVMLEKLENKLVTSEGLRRSEFLSTVNPEDLKEFLLSSGLKLEQFMENMNYDLHAKSFHGSVVSMGWAKKNVKAFQPQTDEQAKKSIEILSDLQKQIEQQLKNISKQFPESDFPDKLL